MPQVIISTGDLDARLRQWVYPEAVEPAKEASDIRRYERPELSCRFEEARTPSQIQLAEIWKWLFKLNQIGIHDDFFELGGDSLLAIRVIAEIREKFNTSLSIDKLFELNTIDKLASHLEALEWLKYDAEEKFASDETRKEFDL
jgi:acyl carrier protein